MTPRPLSTTPVRFSVVVAATLFAITAIAYLPILNHDFINFDDNLYVTENLLVQQGLSWKGVLSVFQIENNLYYHPLTWISHMLDVQLYGLEAGMHHLTSLLTHAANVALLFITLRIATGQIWPSAMVALIFGLHPINSDSVAWIAERKNLLSTFFWLLTMLIYVKYTKRRGVLPYMGMLTAFVLGLLTKPMLVTLPFVLMLMDCWPLNQIQMLRGKGKRAGQILYRLLRDKIPLLALSAAAIITSVHAVSRLAIIVPLEARPYSLRISNALVTYMKYLLKLFIPGHYAIYYPFPESIPTAVVIASTVGLLLITAWCIQGHRQSPWRLFGWCWFLGTLIPVIGIFQSGLWPEMADRWAYVPAIGIYIAVTWEVAYQLARIKKTTGVSIGIALAVGLFFLSSLQITLPHWKNDYTVFSQALSVTDNNHIALRGLGHFHFNRGEYKTAKSFTQSAVDLNPNDPEAHYDLAKTLVKLGETEAALNHFGSAIDIRPDYLSAYIAAAGLLKDTGRNIEAIAYYQKALAISPKDLSIHRQLGEAYIQGSQPDKALDQFKSVVELAPSSHEAFFNYGNALLALGKWKAAATAFKRAISISPSTSVYHINLGYALVQTGDPDGAISHYEKAVSLGENGAETRRSLEKAAQLKGYRDDQLEKYHAQLRINGNTPEILSDMGRLYQELGDLDNAMGSYEKALAVDPGYAPAANAIATIHAREGNYPAAIDYFLQVLQSHPDSDKTSYNLACMFSLNNDPKQALYWLDRTLSLGYDNWNLIDTDKDLANVRKQTEFDRLVRKYRPK